MIDVSGDLFLQLGIVVIIAALTSFILRLLKQPQILAYVLAGVLITPVFGLITDTSIIESMSIIGIAFLLFLVGLEMDLQSLKNVALVSTVGGFIQILILFLLGYILALFLGFFGLEAAYLGLILAFSSTMVVMKLLSDKRELQTLHGRIIIGILLLEDILAIFALSILSHVNGFNFSLFVLAFIKFFSLFVVAYLLSKYFFSSILRVAAKQQELLFVVALAICFLFSLAFQYVGFSIAIGAFIAGITLGNLEYNIEIIGKVKSLRDFFSLLFFVSLGMSLSLAVIRGIWIPLLVLLGVVLIIKPLLIMTICSLFKYTKRPSFQVANSLAQVGEFSLIIATQGLALGHISEEIFSLVVLVALITITTTSYFIKYDAWFYKILRKPLRLFDFFTTEGLEYLSTEVQPRIILCGYNRIGYSILRDLEKVKKKVLIVDYNPEVIDALVQKGYHCLYGDVTDEEVLTHMRLEKIHLLISTVPEAQDNILLIRKVREVNNRARIMVTAVDIDDALTLYEHGANYVILPHFLGGEHVANLIDNVRSNKIKLHEERRKHIEHLHERKRLGHHR